MAKNNLSRVLSNESLNQSELSKASGVGGGTISKVCQQKTNPAPSTKKKIVAGLNKIAKATYNEEDIFG